MSLENVITLDVDIKKLNYFIEPTVTANDRTVFVINLKDNDFPINLVDVSTITLVSKRLDGRSIITPGVKGLVVGHQVVFELGKSETAVNGRVSATVQLYDYAGRVSSIAFGYIVKNDPSASYLLNVGEITLIQIVLEEGPLRIKEATDAAIAANKAVDDVEAKIIEADAVILATETVKDETLIVKDATQLVKDETLIVKNDTLLVKADIEAAAIYNTTQGDYAKAEADRLVGTDVSVLDNKLTTFKSETTALLAEKAKQADLLLKADKIIVDANYSTLDSKINSQVSGAPKGNYATVSALQTAYPTGNTNIYLVTTGVTAGHWYYWNVTTSAWTDGGVYQSAGVADGSITPEKMSDPIMVAGKNKFDKTKVVLDTLLASTGGGTNVIASYATSEYFKTKANFNYFINKYRAIAFYDVDKVNISVIYEASYSANKAFTTPMNTAFVRVSVRTSDINVVQVEEGSVGTVYEPYTPTIQQHKFAPKIASVGVPELNPFLSGFNNYTTALTFENGLVKTAKVMDGTTELSSVTLNFDISGTLLNAIENINGNEVTTTLNYDILGALTSTSNQVTGGI